MDFKQVYNKTLFSITFLSAVILFFALQTSISYALIPSGGLDTEYTSGFDDYDSYIYAVAIQEDDKVIIGGSILTYNGATTRNILRLNTDGSLDTTFNVGTGANNIVRSMAIQQDGKIIIGGSFTSYNGTARNRIARLNSDGSLDTTFNVGTGFSNGTNNINCIEIDGDNKVVVGGRFASYNGTTINNIVRINTSGSIDTSFIVGTGPNNEVISMAMQQDNKIVIGGYFTLYNETGSIRIARINTNGSLDTSFNVGTGVDYGYETRTVVIQKDGKIILGGSFTTFNGTASNNIILLNTDGSVNTTFNVGTGAMGDYSSIDTAIIQQDGKIIIGGNFTSYNGMARNRIARLNSNGSLDTSFDPGTGADGWVGSIVTQEDEKIIIAGYFTSYQDSPSLFLARVSGVSLYQVEPPNEDTIFIDTNTGMTPKVNTDYGINSNEVNILMKKLGLPVALMNLDFSLSDLNLSGITSDSDTTNGKAFFHFDDALTTNTCSPNCNFTDIPGAVGETFSLYIPKLAGHDAVKICPNADSLDDITLSCTSGYTLKQGDENLSVATVDGQEYWVVAGLTGTGGMSILFADTLSRTGDNMLLGIVIATCVLSTVMHLPQLYKIYKNVLFINR